MPLDAVADEFLGGLPEVGRGSGQVSSHQQTALINSRFDREISFRRRSRELRILKAEEQAAVDGEIVRTQISQLDPRDPEFLTKRNNILEARPDSLLDTVTARFLGLQDEVYDEAEHDRQRIEELNLERMRRAEGIQASEAAAERSETRRRERNTEEARQARIDSLSSEARMILEGSEDPDALEQAEQFDVDFAMELALLEGGFEAATIESFKEPDGTLNRKKIARAVGLQKRAAAEAEQRDIQARNLSFELKELKDQIDAAADAITPDENLIKRLNEEADEVRGRLRRLRGIDTSTAPGTPTGGATPEEAEAEATLRELGIGVGA